MKKSDPNRGEERLTEGWIGKMAPDEPGDGISAPESGSRAGVWNLSRWRRVALGGAWMTIFRRGFLRRVDWPRAPRNLRSSVGEELAGKVTSGEEI